MAQPETPDGQIDSTEDGEWLYVAEKFRIRLLRPGDGFVCSQAARQRVTPCTEPVAFARTYHKRRELRKDIEWWSPRVLCSRHLFELLVPKLRTSQEPKYMATQALIDAHRAEFTALCTHYQDVVTAKALAHVPEPLRALIQVLSIELEGEADA
ncbi:hypothetical protein ACWCW7_34450 [Nocardia tengchongensis]